MMPEVYEGELDGSGLRVAIVAARFNEFLVSSLIDGALDALRRTGVETDDVVLARVPGAVELPQICRTLAGSGKFDAIIALGIVIRGATPHFNFVAGDASSGLSRASYDTDVPVTFGVLTTDTIEQAIERSGTKAGNKGHEAAMAAVEMANLVHSLREHGYTRQ